MTGDVVDPSIEEAKRSQRIDKRVMVFTFVLIFGLPTLCLLPLYAVIYANRQAAVIIDSKHFCFFERRLIKRKSSYFEQNFMSCDEASREYERHRRLHETPDGFRIGPTRTGPAADLTLRVIFDGKPIERSIRVIDDQYNTSYGKAELSIRKLEWASQDIVFVKNWWFICTPIYYLVVLLAFLMFMTLCMVEKYRMDERMRRKINAWVERRK